MTKKKKTLAVSKSILNKFKIREHGPKYLPRTEPSTDAKIFSQLVKSALSGIVRASTVNSQNVTDSAADVSLARSTTAPTSSTAPLFRQSQSQIAAAALKAISVGRKNI
jgi:hypothetical protein